MMHHLASSFLAANTFTWVQGPLLPVSLECAVGISETRFLLIGGLDRKDVREFDTRLGATNAEGWIPANTWPELGSGRGSSPACTLLGNRVMVAGSGKVDIIDIETRVAVRGKDMLEARIHFRLAVVGEEGYRRLLALGGDNGASALSSGEWLDEELGVWEEAVGRLRERRSHAGAATVTPEMVCTAQCTEENCPLQGKW